MAAGVHIQISLKDAELRKFLAVAVARSVDLSPVLTLVGERIVAATHRRFEEQVDPEGQPWAKLDERYRKAKELLGYRGMILQRSGRMRSSIHPIVQALQLEVGTNVRAKGGFPYPVIHQLGGEHIPRREFLGLSKEDDDAVADILTDYLAGEL